MKRLSIISIAVLSLLLGTTLRAYAQHDQQGDTRKQEQRDEKKDRKDDKSDKADQKAQPDRPRPEQDARPEARPQEQRQEQRHDQQQAQQRQKHLIDQQQQRLTEYRQHLDQQQRVLQQQTAQLQQQKRSAQYRYQQDYLQHLHQQQAFLNDHHPDYDHDPFFFSAFTFRYNRGGRYYETNQYGADRLRDAANNGYSEGFRAGAADREDQWHFDYEASYAYQDANYGYNGYYVDRDDYNYYFREGFRRGYEDGYYSRLQYGQNNNGVYVMLDINLSQLLGLEPLR